ncbi:hypothetical protein QQZ08_004132 [Neonectria magnoliae]|uniref:BZIP domain-containing protein n=1 Tax=Neonectria magnoliae TaxID=2732573 RepID=A0ABR1I8K3_9HYPO
MSEYQPHAVTGLHAEVYHPYGIDEGFVPEIPCFGAFGPSPDLPEDRTSVLFAPPENSAILANAYAYADNSVGGFVTGQDTISPGDCDAFRSVTESTALPSTFRLKLPDELHPTLVEDPPHPSTAKNPRRKPKHRSSECPTHESTNRKSSRDQDINRQSKKITESSSSRCDVDDGSVNDSQVKQDGKTGAKRGRSRNSIAAHKSRAKKKAASQRLKYDLRRMEETHSRSTQCVADLTSEIHQTKMLLLEHTDCDCSLIHIYNAHEARQFARGIEGNCNREGHVIPRS